MTDYHIPPQPQYAKQLAGIEGRLEQNPLASMMAEKRELAKLKIELLKEQLDLFSKIN